MADAQAHPQTATATGSVPTPGVTLSTNLWMDWAEIAILHARRAREARTYGEAAGNAGTQAEQAHYLSYAEVRLSMVATTAAAFALAGLDGVFRPFVDLELIKSWMATDTKRAKSNHDQIRLGLYDCFDTRGPLRAQMDEQFPWLFRLVRDPAVHHEPESRPPEDHPVEGMGGVAQERAWYVTENADRAVRFMLSVIELVGSPKLAVKPAVMNIAKDFTWVATDLQGKWEAT